MLGHKVTFDYIIEGEEVILLNHLGGNRDIIIPNFITSIREGAFSESGLTSVTLGTGIKYLGTNAFEGCNISEIVIHQTIQFIGTDAFQSNKKLINDRGEYTNNIKILGQSTLIIKEHNNRI